MLLRQKVGEVMEKIRAASKVEILDEDLKKIADETAKPRKLLLEQQNKKAVTGDAATEGDGSGKGDLLLPEDGNTQQ